MLATKNEGANQYLEFKYLELFDIEPPGYGPDYVLYRDAMDVQRKCFINEHPLGLSQLELNFSLDTPEPFWESCAASLSRIPTYTSYNFEAMQHAPELGKWLRSFGERFSLWELGQALSFAEIARFAQEQECSGSLSDQIYEHPFFRYVAKLALSTWHWYTPYDEGSHRVTWSRVMDFHKFFTTFDFGLSGFEVTIDHSISWMNVKGPATYADSARFTQKPVGKEVWLDGEFALLVSVKGEHVLTIGVSPTNAGLLVNQIQLRKEKGNRWLYKLGKSYFEHVLERLYLACTDANLDLFFVTSESLLPFLKALHTKGNPWAGDDERLMRLYNQLLPGFERGSEKIHVNGLEYFSLKLVQEVSLVAAA
jgi:hypothetical protein